MPNCRIVALCQEKIQIARPKEIEIFFTHLPAGHGFISIRLLETVPVQAADLPIFNHQGASPAANIFKFVAKREGQFLHQLERTFLSTKEVKLLRPCFDCLEPLRLPRALSRLDGEVYDARWLEYGQ